MKKEDLNKLPLSPGVYIFKDKDGEVLYVGKAGRLRARVRSYFSTSNDLSDFKKMMVGKIADVETIITSNENEALILEAVLIKKHQPPYNIILKDDKNYQFIKIDYRYNEPIVTTVRRPEEDKGRSRARYFGPYTSGLELKENLRLLRRVFPWRKKARPATRFEEELLAKRSVAPLPESEDEYRAMIKNFTRVLEGRSEEAIKNLRQKMRECASTRHYEKAALLRNQITALQQINSRQKIVSVKGESQDVVSLFIGEDNLAAINVFVIRAGKLIDKLNFLLQNVAGESPAKILQAFLLQYYQEATNISKEIIIPMDIDLTSGDLKKIITSSVILEGGRPKRPTDRIPASDSGTLSPALGGLPASPAGGQGDIKITIPRRGKKRDLIKLGEENARDFLEKHLASWQKQNNDEALRELREKLNLEKLPARIEGYDISNIQGKMAVGSMVVFTDGQPDKKEYRKFKIKTIKGADDFKMLAEVLQRRFAKEGWLKPDLVLLDGGKGQLSVVLESLFPVILEGAKRPIESQRKSNLLADKTMGFYRSPAGAGSLQNDMQVCQFIALAKKQEEIFQGIFIPSVETHCMRLSRYAAKKMRRIQCVSTKKINIPSDNPASFLLQRVRDEAHRFAQSYFHVLQSKGGKKSRLDEIPGLGPKTKKLLLQKYGSLAGIRYANRNEIINLIGEKKTRNLFENV